VKQRQETAAREIGKSFVPGVGMRALVIGHGVSHGKRFERSAGNVRRARMQGGFNTSFLELLPISLFQLGLARVRTDQKGLFLKEPLATL